MGPLPTVDRMIFKALQTYSDGEGGALDRGAGRGAAEPGATPRRC